MRLTNAKFQEGEEKTRKDSTALFFECVLNGSHQRCCPFVCFPVLLMLVGLSLLAVECSVFDDWFAQHCTVGNTCKTMTETKSKSMVVKHHIPVLPTALQAPLSLPLSLRMRISSIKKQCVHLTAFLLLSPQLCVPSPPPPCHHTSKRPPSMVREQWTGRRTTSRSCVFLKQHNSPP